MAEISASKKFDIVGVEIEIAGTIEGADHSVGIMSAGFSESWVTMFGHLDVSAMWQMLHELKKLHRDTSQDVVISQLETRVEESLQAFEEWIRDEVVKDSLDDALNEQANEPDLPDYD